MKSVLESHGRAAVVVVLSPEYQGIPLTITGVISCLHCKIIGNPL